MVHMNLALDPNRTGHDAEALERNLRRLIVGQDEAIEQLPLEDVTWRQLRGVVRELGVDLGHLAIEFAAQDHVVVDHRDDAVDRLGERLRECGRDVCGRAEGGEGGQQEMLHQGLPQGSVRRGTLRAGSPKGCPSRAQVIDNLG